MRSYGDDGFQATFLGFAVTGGADLASARAALEMHERACAPMPRDLVLKELAVVKVCTKARPEHQDDLKFMMQVYAEKLAEWPADVVRHVLTTQPSISKWWPAWEELEDRLSLYGRKRRARRDALRRMVAEDGR